MSRRSTWIAPLVGSISRLIIFRVVVFPDEIGPVTRLEGHLNVITTVENNIITNNTAYSNGGSGCSVSWCSHNNTLSNNTIYLGYVGIGNGQGAYNNIIRDNNIRNMSASGIRVIYSTHNSSIFNNHISNCRVGIEITEGFDNKVYNNNVSDSENGTAFTRSSGNRVYLNNFINNTNEVYSEDSTDNLWNSTEELRYTYNNTTYTDYLGNYWDGYNEDDGDGDGIGDTSFDMGYATDDHPLMKHFDEYHIIPPAFIYMPPSYFLYTYIHLWRGISTVDDDLVYFTHLRTCSAKVLALVNCKSYSFSTLKICK